MNPNPNLAEEGGKGKGKEEKKSDGEDRPAWGPDLSERRAGRGR